MVSGLGKRTAGESNPGSLTTLKESILVGDKLEWKVYLFDSTCVTVNRVLKGRDLMVNDLKMDKRAGVGEEREQTQKPAGLLVEIVHTRAEPCYADLELVGIEFAAFHC